MGPGVLGVSLCGSIQQKTTFLPKLGVGRSARCTEDTPFVIWIKDLDTDFIQLWTALSPLRRTNSVLHGLLFCGQRSRSGSSLRQRNGRGQADP